MATYLYDCFTGSCDSQNSFSGSDRTGLHSGCWLMTWLIVLSSSSYVGADDGQHVLRIGDGKDWHCMTGGDVQVDWKDTQNGIDPMIDKLYERKRAFYAKHAFDDVTIDFKVNLRYNAQGAGRAGVILRAQDPTHYYLVYLPHSAQVYRAKNFWVAVAKVEGDEYIRNLKLVWVPNVPAETDRWYDVRVEAKGSKPSLYSV